MTGTESNKLQLPEVTLLCADCVNVDKAVNVLKRCTDLCDFGAVKLLTSEAADYEHKVEIIPLKSLVAYSIFCLTKLHEYVNTSHVLVVQADGFILNPKSWNPDWLKLDYVAPLFVEEDRIGSGGFSLRSNKLMKEAADRMPKWDGTQAHADSIQTKLYCYEDGYLSHLCEALADYKAASLEEGAKFAQAGNKAGKHYQPYPFGFHGLRQNIIFETGLVHPVCKHKGEDCMCSIDLLDYLRINNL